MDTTEKNFETVIEESLLVQGYLKRESKHYDKANCLDADTLFNFLRSTQPETWDKLKIQHGNRVRENFLKRLVKEIESRGTLNVLRKGVDDVGCHFDLAYFKPETTHNIEHQKLYQANLFSVIRQLYYSEINNNSIDSVIFLNGLPIFTLELKNPLKGQDVTDAVEQYRQNRSPKKEPLLKFQRCLAHFAVDTNQVFMTTQLAEKKTFFLPFNKGDNGGAGNPLNPNGFKTAYFWEETLAKDSILGIIWHFLQVVDVLDDDNKPTGEKRLIFPRYHQLDAVRKMVNHAKELGPGRNYLIEHSAGSGKSNTIAWLAHQLSSLHGESNNRVFDTIIVITDRRVLDWQLRKTVQSFEQTKGLVSAIETQKSTKLAEALSAGKDIITTTIQTFPFVIEKLTEIKANNFAILIDEAHSSQTGETARSLKQTLATASLETAEKDDITETEDGQDVINRRVEELLDKTGRLSNVSFFAFTATPKSKTLEMFGSEMQDGCFVPFSLYSMHQAIQEGFILDVLKNYTTFKVYFELNKKIKDDPEFPAKKAMIKLKQYADLKEHSIRAKSEIMIEHFDNNMKKRINGQAKAMVVTRSRLHAVRYKQMFDKILKEKGYDYEALVAFSGVVKDPDTMLEFTEASMNGFSDTATANTFKKNKYRFMIVAEKFQTGFDQPLLQVMYVDKTLSNVNAVQTLSRLNRRHADKDKTFVLDFANETDDIQKAFQPYYETTILSERTDPNKLYDLKRKVEEFLYFQKQHVEDFASIYFSKKGTQKKLRAILDPIVEVYMEHEKTEREDFKKAVTDFVRMYGFLSHVIKFQDVFMEKTYQFLRLLRPLLPIERERLPEEITEAIGMAKHRINQTSSGDIVLENEDGKLKPASDIGTGRKKEDLKAPLSVILEYINEHFGTEFSPDDDVVEFAENMQNRLIKEAGLRNAMDPEINQSEENRRMAFNDYFDQILQDMFESHIDIYKKLVDDKKFGEIFKTVMFAQTAKALMKKRGG